MKHSILAMMLVTSFALVGCLEETTASSNGAAPDVNDTPADSTDQPNEPGSSTPIATSSSGAVVDTTDLLGRSSSGAINDSTGYWSAVTGTSSANDGGTSVDGGNSSWNPVDSTANQSSANGTGSLGSSSSGTSAPGNLSSPIDSLGWAIR